MFTVTKYTGIPAGMIEVRVRHIDDEGDGALLGYFAPQQLAEVRQIVSNTGVYFNEEPACGEEYQSACDTQFVVDNGRVFYELVFGGPDED